MTPKFQSIGKKLRQLREKQGLGIKTAGKAIDFSYTYLSKVENGHKPPSADLIEKLSDLYGADPEELMAGMAELPNDIQVIIRERGKEVFELLRATYPSKTQRKEPRKRE